MKGEREGGMREERGGRKKEEKLLKLPPGHTIVFNIICMNDPRIGLCNRSVYLVSSPCLQSVAYDSGGDVKSRIKQSLGLETLFECVTKTLCVCVFCST